MKKLSMLLAVILSFALVTPAFAEEPDVFDELAVIDETEIISDSMESLEIDLPEDIDTSIDANIDASSESVSEETAPEPVGAAESFDSVEATMALDSVNSSANNYRYYNQPLWYTSNGYDAIAVWLTDESGAWVQRCFFVTDGAEWLLYDYGELAAAEFFSKTEQKSDNFYVPVQKATARKDNKNTADIDESKIPTMTLAAYEQMVYDWRVAANIPFTRDSSGQIIYAGEKSDDDDVQPTPVPEPDEDLTSTVITINNNVYTVLSTTSVVYNGKKHVLSTAKSNKSQTADIRLVLYRNGEELPASSYTVKFFNNVNVNGYGGKNPYFTITLKGNKLKADKTVLASNKFGLKILPADIGTANLAVKGVKYNNGTLTLTSPTVKIDGLTLKLAARTAKNRQTGAYVAGYRDGNVIVYGTNNYAGSFTIPLTSAKTISWTF